MRSNQVQEDRRVWSTPVFLKVGEIDPLGVISMGKEAIGGRKKPRG